MSAGSTVQRVLGRTPERFGRFARCESVGPSEGFWLWIGGPVAPGAAATTVGRVVLVRAGQEHDARLLRHEAEHVRQYRRYGLAGFLVRYLWDYGRWRLRLYPHWAAYRRIGFEVEAEWLSRRTTG